MVECVYVRLIGYRDGWVAAQWKLKSMVYPRARWAEHAEQLAWIGDGNYCSCGMYD